MQYLSSALFISKVAYTHAGIIGLQSPAYLLGSMLLLMAVPRGRFRDSYRRLQCERDEGAVAQPALQGQA